MSVAGFKKQIYKATQMMSEKVGGAEGTKLDEDFKELERRADITSKAYVEVINKTSEYLQPNPATRAKLAMLNMSSKIRGQATSPGYPQPEGQLGECMTKYGMDMGADNIFGTALVEVGETMKQMAEIKDRFDLDVKQTFIDPLQLIADKDVKEIQHHLKKLEGHRLDYDYKKKRQGKIPDEEIRQALDKFHKSKDSAECSMHNLLETDVEQVTQLNSFVQCMLQYHKQAAEVLQNLSGTLVEKVNEAQSRPKREYTPKPRQSFDYGQAENSNGGHSSGASSPPAYSPAEPQCKALYDFEPENHGELGFQEGDIITLLSQIDENWFEGSIGGRTGFFPNNYVEVLVPLP